MPFILRGASLLGINSGESSHDIREMVWRRLASDLKPPLLKEMARTIAFARAARRCSTISSTPRSAGASWST